MVAKGRKIHLSRLCCAGSSAPAFFGLAVVSVLFAAVDGWAGARPLTSLLDPVQVQCEAEASRYHPTKVDLLVENSKEVSGGRRGDGLRLYYGRRYIQQKHFLLAIIDRMQGRLGQADARDLPAEWRAEATQIHNLLFMTKELLEYDELPLGFFEKPSRRLRAPVIPGSREVTQRGFGRGGIYEGFEHYSVKPTFVFDPEIMNILFQYPIYGEGLLVEEFQHLKDIRAREAKFTYKTEIRGKSLKARYFFLTSADAQDHPNVIKWAKYAAESLGKDEAYWERMLREEDGYNVRLLKELAELGRQQDQNFNYSSLIQAYQELGRYIDQVYQAAIRISLPLNFFRADEEIAKTRPILETMSSLLAGASDVDRETLRTYNKLLDRDGGGEDDSFRETFLETRDFHYRESPAYKALVVMYNAISGDSVIVGHDQKGALMGITGASQQAAAQRFMEVVRARANLEFMPKFDACLEGERKKREAQQAQPSRGKTFYIDWQGGRISAEPLPPGLGEEEQLAAHLFRGKIDAIQNEVEWHGIHQYEENRYGEAVVSYVALPKADKYLKVIFQDKTGAVFDTGAGNKLVMSGNVSRVCRPEDASRTICKKMATFNGARVTEMGPSDFYTAFYLGELYRVIRKLSVEKKESRYLRAQFDFLVDVLSVRDPQDEDVRFFKDRILEEAAELN